MLLIAGIVAIAARRIRLPYTVGLVLAGILLVVVRVPLDISLTKELIFSVFLPPLIFEAAYQIPWDSLKRELPLLSVMATVGVLLSAAVTSAVMVFLCSWPIVSAMLFGVLIAATDPVSVIAIFKEHKVAPRLRMLVESEALLNDGTAAVLFAVILAAVAGVASTPLQIGGAFVVTVVGGIACGFGVAVATMALAGRTEDHLIEILFTFIGAYASFLLAEHFELSGVLSTMTAGLVMGNANMFGGFSQKGREHIVSFWEFAAFAVNSLVFLLIGTRLAQNLKNAELLDIAVAVVAVVAGRALSVYATCAPFVRSKLGVPFGTQHALVWGGLRGALALALALSLPGNVPGKEGITTAAFGVVAFSVIVQGLTVGPFIFKASRIERALDSSA